jgi:hypothetical protein
MVRQAVASGMFPEAGGTLPAVGMAGGVETTQEAGTAASTMADAIGRGTVSPLPRLEGQTPFEPRTLYVQPN